MAGPFQPGEHPTLIDLGSRLRELAGDNAYTAGRDYLKKGLVKQATVAGTTAYASVAGSTDYRVSIAFAGEPKVACSCPAHRRNKYCKHVVAVCEALIQRPESFTPTDPLPEATAPAMAAPKEKKPRAPRQSKAKQQEEQRGAGLESLDRLLDELAAGGLITLGPDKADLIAATGELVRALKLRRLGNLVMALQRAAAGDEAQRESFPRLLLDLYLTRMAVGAHLEGRVALDPTLAEELLGKVWRETDLELATGLNLVEVAYERQSDGEFRIETSYLIDLASGQLYLEKQISPVKLAAGPKPSYRHRILVEAAGLYPGPSPRRIKLARGRRAPLTAADIERWLAHGATSLAQLRLRLGEQLSSPFGPAELPVLVRPTALVTQASLVGLLDQAGEFLPITWPAKWSKELPGLLPEPESGSGAYALFGLLSLTPEGMSLRPLTVLSPAFRWSRGPIYPEQGQGR